MMATQDDDENQQPGLGQALLNYPRPRPGLGGALSGAPAPVAKRVPGYTDSRTGKFVPLLPGVSPAAFAAQQGTAMQNALAGYGAETLHMGRSLGHFLKGMANAAQGNFVPLMLPNPSEPDEDMGNDLMANSAAARGGAFLADIVNTAPAEMVGGELVGPLARAIQGEGRLAAAARAGIIGAGKGMGKGLMMPADDAEERLENIGIEGLRKGLKKAVAGYSKSR